MRLILSRNRCPSSARHLEYRVLIPHDELTIERQYHVAAIAGYGHPGGPYAGVSLAIAPMHWLRLPPGPEKYNQGRAIDEVARAIEAVLIRVAYPEMTAERVPLLFSHDAELPDLQLAAHADLIDRFDGLQGRPTPLTAADLQLVLAPRPA